MEQHPRRPHVRRRSVRSLEHLRRHEVERAAELGQRGVRGAPARGEAPVSQLEVRVGRC